MIVIATYQDDCLRRCVPFWVPATIFLAAVPVLSISYSLSITAVNYRNPIAQWLTPVLCAFMA